MQQKTRKQSRFIRAHEIFQLAQGLTPNQWYSLVARGRIPGVERKPDDWGYLVPRRAFLKWLEAHPQYKQSPQCQSAVDLRTNENSPKGSPAHESPSSRNLSTS